MSLSLFNLICCERALSSLTSVGAVLDAPSIVPSIMITWLLCWTSNKMSRLMTKPTKWHVRPAKTQVSLGIRPVWSESSLSAWRKLGSLATHWAHSEDSDQTGRMPRLIWVFAGRTATLLVLSCRGSIMPLVVSRFAEFLLVPEVDCYLQLWQSLKIRYHHSILFETFKLFNEKEVKLSFWKYPRKSGAAM